VKTRPVAKFLLAVLIAAYAVLRTEAGNIQGNVLDLKGATVDDAKIIVRDLVTRKILDDTQKSGPAGAYNQNLPDGVSVSVSFEKAGRIPAALEGLSGSVKLKGLDVVMPAQDCCCPMASGECCVTAVNCCEGGHGRRFFRCRR
jgi:hypothetical protein